MSCLMGQRRGVIQPIWELIEARNVDGLWRVRAIECAVPAVSDLNTDAGKKRFRSANALIGG